MGSAILSPEARPHWELIQNSEGGTATLLRHYEEYANTLAQNMRKTYLSPFTIVTPNIGTFFKMISDVISEAHPCCFCLQSFLWIVSKR